VIDNYGDFIMIPNENNTPYKYNSISKYILPNILIDTIKNFSSGVRLSNYINFLQQIQIISKDYYNRFTKYKSLHQSEEQQKEDNSKKNILIKSLREENNKLNNLIATIKEKNNETDKLKQLNNKYIKTIVELNTQNVKKCASESDSESDDNSSDSESESASAPETESDSDANV
jgi:formate dehydrogenase maturation protein FdhE